MVKIWKNLGEPFFSKEKAGIVALTTLIEFFFGVFQVVERDAFFSKVP